MADKNSLTPGLHIKRLQHIRASYEASKQGHAFIGHPSYDEQIAIVDALLATLTDGMEHEPVYQVQHGDQWRDLNKAQYDDHVNLGAEGLRILYAAPQLPQPAVPECYQRLLHHAYGMTMGHDWNKGTMAGHHREKLCKAVEGCRAAMLQGAEPVQDWIPCSERMPEEFGRYWCYVEEQNSLGKSHYQWNCSWNGDRWWVESENGGRVTHWMPLQEPPKQTAES